MCAYMHDIGMLYTEDEVRELWKKDEFTAFLQDACRRSHEAAKAVSLVEGAMMPEGDGKKLWALEVRQSVTIHLMEYYHSRHGLPQNKGIPGFRALRQKAGSMPGRDCRQQALPGRDEIYLEEGPRKGAGRRRPGADAGAV